MSFSCCRCTICIDTLNRHAFTCNRASDIQNEQQFQCCQRYSQFSWRYIERMKLSDAFIRLAISSSTSQCAVAIKSIRNTQRMSNGNQATRYDCHWNREFIAQMFTETEFVCVQRTHDDVRAYWVIFC